MFSLHIGPKPKAHASLDIDQYYEQFIFLNL